ncbi:MAG: serine acetyltransferase [Fluviicola sp.]|nr:serine acetyltransferase [Fluviicola sp.]
MINSKTDYKLFLEKDLLSYQLSKYSLSTHIKNPIVRFQRRLRKIEYLTNCKSGLIHTAYRKYLRVINTRLAIRLNFTIPINTFDSGLCLPHYGTIVVTSTTIGKNCRIHPGVSIGNYHGTPKIGNNVYIGPGAKLFGNISIGDNVSIGANSVVTKSFESNVSIAGNPAKIISRKTTKELGMYPEGVLK